MWRIQAGGWMSSNSKTKGNYSLSTIPYLKTLRPDLFQDSKYFQISERWLSVGIVSIMYHLQQGLSWNLKQTLWYLLPHTHTHTHTHIYISVYVYIFGDQMRKRMINSFLQDKIRFNQLMTSGWILQPNELWKNWLSELFLLWALHVRNWGLV